MTTKVYYEGRTYEVREGESVLEALVRGGASVRFSCRKGSCHTCMLRAPVQPPPEASQRGLSMRWAEGAHFLPCIAHPTTDLHTEPPAAAASVDALVAAKTQVSERVFRLELEVESSFTWTPGQHVSLVRADDVSRSYSASSVGEEDYFLVLHVARVEGGALSPWIADELSEGDVVQLRGPFGGCTYRDDDVDAPLAFLATGTGVGPVLGVVRDAIRRGHRGPIRVVHGVRAHARGYAGAELAALVASRPNVFAIQVVDEDPVAKLFEDPSLGEGTVLFLFGNPDAVHDARVRAVGAGIRRSDVRADPFDDAREPWPRDREKLDATPADPEMWEALDRGEKLRAILEEFYAIVFEDPQLAPFFHNVTKERAISKQYEFLYDVFSKEIIYFGLRPFNAHHWMVITDELFDYREELFEDVVRKHGVPEPLIRRWMAFQERFRREIVKARPRGMIVDGVEVKRDGFSEERLLADMVCDGCHGEMLEGEIGRMHQRTGELFCARCASRVQSVAPPPA